VTNQWGDMGNTFNCKKGYAPIFSVPVRSHVNVYEQEEPCSSSLIHSRSEAGVKDLRKQAAQRAKLLDGCRSEGYFFLLIRVSLPR
jgi:hypothetical protein